MDLCIFLYMYDFQESSHIICCYHFDHVLPSLLATLENDLRAVQHMDTFPFTIEIHKQIFILGRG